MSVAATLHAVVLACAAYLVVLYGSYAVLTAVGAVENLRRRDEAELEDFETLGESPYTASVSILLAAYNEASTIVSAVRSLLALEYQTFEVIVVNDGSSDATLERLRQAFGLFPVEIADRCAVAAGPVRAFYRSALEPRLVGVDKENGGKADALNVGLNLCRYRYVCGVDADAVFAPDALLRTMRVFIREPGHVVGLTSYIEIGENPSAALRAPTGRRATDGGMFIGFQVLDYLRAFFNNRLAWSRFDFMLCAIGAFQVWRRDLLDELGGWSRDYTCEDIELTFRVHERMRLLRRPYRILCLPDTVGVTEGPNTVRKLVAQRERWQRVTLETWWAYRHMCLNPRYGAVGLLGMPFYLLSEILAPVFEVATLLTIVAAAAAGLVDWRLCAWVTIVIALANAVFNAAAVLADEIQSATYRTTSLARLLALGPLELILYRPVIGWARVKGTWRFLRGDKRWHKFERNLSARAA
jgi:biofilm PGA synthesis N-glycosyltransferase PgaC